MCLSALLVPDVASFLLRSRHGALIFQQTWLRASCCVPTQCWENRDTQHTDWWARLPECNPHVHRMLSSPWAQAGIPGPLSRSPGHSPHSIRPTV